MTLDPKNISWGEEDIENVFGFHKATIEGPNASGPAHAELRVRFREFMGMLDMALPPGRTKAIVRTKMQEASMFSHFAIAEPQPIVNEPLPDYGDQSHHLVTDAKIDRYEQEEEPLIREAEWEAANPAPDDYYVDRQDNDDDYPGAPLKGQ